MDRAYSALEVKGVNEEARIIRGLATSPVPDREGDVVEPMGAKYAQTIPLFLYHDSKLTVGTVKLGRPTADGIPFEASIPKIAEPGALQQRVDEAWQMVKYKLIAAVSIGFRGIEGKIERLKTGGLRFLETEILELSLVPIPMQSLATIHTIKGFDSETRKTLGLPNTALPAASGHTQSDPPPGASGTKQQPADRGLFYSRSQKGLEVKTITQLREERSTKAARLQELVELFKTADHEATDEEGAEFDTLSLEVKAIDTEIRVASFNATQASASRAVEGKSADEGSRSRGMSYVKTQDPEDKFEGQSYTRFLIAKAAAFCAMKDGAYVSPAEIAQHRWGKTHPKLVQMIKAAVAGGAATSGEWGAELAQSDTKFAGDFIEYLYSKTVFDRLPLRSIPARVHVKGQDGAATGYWVGESLGIPVSKADFSDVELTPLKVGAMAVCSKELVADSSPSAEMLIRDSIVQASSQRVDTTFLSSSAAVSGVSPAGILNGVSALAPSGADAAAVRADFQALVQPFITAKNASGLVQVMSPSMAMALSMLVNSLGQTEFPDIMEEGGSLFKRPVYTGDNVTAGDWIVLKPSDIWKIGDGGVQVSMSDTATIEQNDAPQGDGITPTAASATLMSLWQTEQIGFKVVRRINYAKRRTGAVTVLSNGEYGGVVS